MEKMDKPILTELSEQLRQLFGAEADYAAVSRLLHDHPTLAFEALNFRVDQDVVAAFQTLEDSKKKAIVERFKLLADYDMTLDPMQRIKVLNELRPVFEAFLQWENPPEEERPHW